MRVPLLSAGLTGLAALVLLPGLLIGPSLDAAVFVQVSREVSDGAALYAEAWDHKPPGIYLVLAALQFALPVLDPWPIAWGVTVFATGGAATAVAVATRRVGVGERTALVVSVAAVMAMAQYLLSLGGGLTESLATLPLAVALALVLAPPARGPGRGAAVGALLSVALLFSLQVFAGAAVLVALVVWRAPAGGRVPAVAGLFVGALVPALVAVAPLLHIGSLDSAIDAVIGYSVAYGAIDTPAGDRLVAPLVAWTFLALLFLVVPAVLGAAGMLRTAGLRRDAALASLTWIGLSIGLFVYQGRFYGHYVIPLVPPLALLASSGVERALAGAGGWSAGAVRLAPVSIGVLISVLAGVAGGRMEANTYGGVNMRARAVGAAVQQATDPADRIWVWGNAPQLYVHAERRQATPYAYLFPLTTPGYATPAMIGAVVADLAANPPRLIVDAGSAAPGSPGFLPLLIPRPVASEGRDLDILDPVRVFVADRYEVDRVVDGWTIYRLRPVALADGSIGRPELAAVYRFSFDGKVD